MARSRIDVVVGRNLSTRRIGLGVTSQQLAQKLGTSAELVNAYEEGSVRVPPQMLLDIARTLRVPPLSFFSEVGDGGDSVGEDLMVRASEKLEQSVQLLDDLTQIEKPKMHNLVLQLAVAVDQLRQLLNGRSLEGELRH